MFSIALTSGGSVDNMQGLMSSGGTTSLQDTNLAAKNLTVINTGGTLIAGQNLAVDSAGLTGDGKLLSQGDLNIRLASNYTHTGQLLANGAASMETTGTLVNASVMSAGSTLTIKAATVDNQGSGEISAGQLRLETSGSQVNRGLIDGQETTIEAALLANLGTGRIYGDHVAIGATTVTNDAENGAAPVIAARERLDIGATTINNREHALIFSAGNMAIGGSLDANKHAAGQASILNNNSATIEALGSLDLAVRQINNTNEHFSTTVQSMGSEYIVEYQGSGSPNRYLPGTPDVYIFNDESDYLHTPEGNYAQWSKYSYTRTTTETRVQSSDPGQILSGGAMQINADRLLNDKSRIIAGGTLTGDIGTLENTEVEGQRVFKDAGTVTSFWRQYEKGIDTTGSSTSGYNPPDTIQAISLTPTVYLQNAAPGGTGTQIASLATGSVTQAPAGANAASVSIGNGPSISPITQVAALNGGNAAGPALVVRSGGVNTSVPDNSLFRPNPNPAAGYLIETDPRFANYRTWLSSDYLLNALSIDPAATQKRLGDGFYEQKLIREQVAQLTGRRFLDGYASDEAQYQALMENAATFAWAYELRPGVALTAEQMAALTSDIVWLVEKDVTLPDGQVVKALVPQLYVRVQDGDLQASGALIAGSSVQLNVAGDLVNSGTIAGRDVVVLNAENVRNLGGRIAGNDVGVAARTDLDNIGGMIEAGNSLTAVAGRDLNMVSTTRTQANEQGSRTNIDRVAALHVTGSGSTLFAAAGRDINLAAAAILNAAPPAAGLPAGSTVITAGNDLNLTTVAEASSNSIAWDANNFRKDSSSTDIGSTIQTRGDLRLQAGNDINATAASITSDDGALVAAAGRNVNLMAGEIRNTVDEGHQHKGRSSTLASKTITTRDTLDETRAQGSLLSGETVTVQAGQDLAIRGSSVVSTQDTTLVARNDIRIEAATGTTVEGHFRDEKKSGVFSGGGIGVTAGTQQQTVDSRTTRELAAASVVGSTDGDVVIRAGQNYRQAGSDVLALQGSIDIAAQRVDIVEARNSSDSSTETVFKQSGLTLALTSPVISAIQTAQQMKQAAGQTSDKRMQALAGINTGLAGLNAYDAVKAGQADQIVTGKNADGSLTTRDGNAADKAGGVNISISIGASKSESKTVQTSSTAAGSTVAAGGDIRISAAGAGADSDLTIQGSNVRAGGNVLLAAQDQINLLAAQNTDEQHSTNKSSSGSIGISFGTGGFGITASASKGRGNADGKDVTWTNTHVEAGQTLVIASGGDATLKGAVATGEQVIAQIGGNLQIESLQDTSVYASKQSSAGGSLTIGAGVSGSVNASKSNINSNFASVTEQSGIRAGDGGFTVVVAGDTTLTGGAITSSEQAVQQGINRFDTGGSLTLTDIENHASYSAKSTGINVGSGVSTDGKLAPGGTSAGFGRDSGEAASVTQAAISGIAGNRDARTGDAESGIARIFDADKVQKEINAQVQITQTFSREAPKAVAAFAQSSATDLREQARVETDPDKRKALLEEAKKWDEGGIYRVALHTASGALAGGIGGAAGAAVTAGAAEWMDELQSAAQKALQAAGLGADAAKVIAQGVANLTAVGVGAAVGGTQGAAMGLAVDANNRQLHPTQTALLKQKAKELAATCSVPARCASEAEWEARLAKELLAMNDAAFANLGGDVQAQSALLELQATSGVRMDYRNSAEYNDPRINMAATNLPGVAAVYRNAGIAYASTPLHPYLQSTQYEMVRSVQDAMPALVAGGSLTTLSATGFVLGSGFDAAGQLYQNGYIRLEQAVFSGATGAIGLPLASKTGPIGNAVVGGGVAGMNTIFNNLYYDEETSVLKAMGIGTVFGLGASIAGTTASRELTRILPREINVPATNPKIPLLLQNYKGTPNPYPAMIGSGVSNTLGGIPSFIPVDNGTTEKK